MQLSTSNYDKNDVLVFLSPIQIVGSHLIFYLKSIKFDQCAFFFEKTTYCHYKPAEAFLFFPKYIWANSNTNKMVITVTESICT